MNIGPFITKFFYNYIFFLSENIIFQWSQTFWGRRGRSFNLSAPFLNMALAAAKDTEFGT